MEVAFHNLEPEASRPSTVPQQGEVVIKIDPWPEGSCSTHLLSMGKWLTKLIQSQRQGKAAITIDPEPEGSCSIHPLRYLNKISGLIHAITQDPSPSTTLATGASLSGSSTISEIDIERSSDHPSRNSTSSRLHSVAKLYVILYWLMASLGGQAVNPNHFMEQSHKDKEIWSLKAIQDTRNGVLNAKKGYQSPLIGRSWVKHVRFLKFKNYMTSPRGCSYLNRSKLEGYLGGLI
ncbi:hypothetical protein RJ639_024384 [Escallonia herrerae]|uniref:Uncharacterized protein n=1 Tax=Escallonia herrerae TaxID=1293975 RepID=A0AA88V1V2_9ASTE|nr:hypothetical protein RJ639_024384 [Escallonia herrerae]